MQRASKEEMMEQVLFVLNKYKIRATYSAVTSAIYPEYQDSTSFVKGISQLLGNRRPYASWVVSKSTGKPTGYAEDECHRELFLNDTVLDADDLIRLMLDD